MDFTIPDRDYKIYSQKISSYLKTYFRSIGCIVFSSPFDIIEENNEVSQADINIVSNTSANIHSIPDIIISIAAGIKSKISNLFAQNEKMALKNFGSFLLIQNSCPFIN